LPFDTARSLTRTLFQHLFYVLGIVVLSCALPAMAEKDKDSTYDAPLPVQIQTGPALCPWLPCNAVFPAAVHFSDRKGRPAYVEAYGEDKTTVLGYVFLSTDIVDIPAYSGKPVVTLIGMDIKGVITGIKILRHSEPILLVGIPESELTKYIKQFIGKHAWDKIEIGSARKDAGYIGVDAISGATVTVIAENQVVMRSAYEIARQVGIIKTKPREPARFTNLQAAPEWNALIKEGSIQHLRVEQKDVGLETTDKPYIDLYFGYLNAPAIGRSILGGRNYKQLMADLKANEHALFIVANGSASFKGSGFVRGGIYDRIQVAQDMDSFTFRDTDYLNLYNIHSGGAPDFQESGIFIIRNAAFSAAYPWNLVFLGNKIDQQTGTRSFANFDREYWLPEHYLEGGRPEIIKPEATWVAIWKSKISLIAVFTLTLVAAIVFHAKRDPLLRRSTHRHKPWIAIPKYIFWSISIVFFGFVLLAQPSITHILTWVHSLVFDWKWELFLSDQFIFVFWWFILLTVLLWGRGLFCGWLCPYGSMTELLYKAVHATPLRRFQFSLPMPIHNKLKWLKYAIFLALLASSFYSMGMAEKLAEVEPFKSTFLINIWDRSWPFIVYWLALLMASAFIERPFCKYLCPLGAALAIPTTFRQIGLKRKQECTRCTACAKGCGSLSINAQGAIDQRECLLCLDCMVLYYDDHGCPPLSSERKRRHKAGLPLTPINTQGYFIPVENIGHMKQKTQMNALALPALAAFAHPCASRK
jgi:NosR/NirI family transcriptional regulator, nitrous oxide reductase regulator